MITLNDIKNSNNYVLLLTVQSNIDAENNIRAKTTNEFKPRDFELESIRCIKSWREKAGWLKDIKIIIFNPSNDVQEKTKLKYAELNVDYINDQNLFKNNNFEKLDYGFVNVHYTGAIFEDIIEEPFIIHIDLDMELLQEIKFDFFKPLLNFEILCGSYIDDDFKFQREPIFSDELLNTDFIVTKSKNFKTININFYKEFIKNIISVKDNKQIKKSYDIEEYGCDKTFSEFKKYLYLLKEYEQGEGYFRTYNFKNYFWHQHITSKIDLDLLKYKQLNIKGLQC